MNCKYTNLAKNELENCILCFIPKNKRGFSSSFKMVDIFRCIVHKLKTGCQWSFLFVYIEGLKPPFSWQTVYYYYRKWSEKGVFREMFETYLEIKKDTLDTEKLNLDGTHSLVKKSAQSAAYQHRKRGRTSNILIMTEGKGSPISNGGIISGNHNDLFEIVPQYAKMINGLKNCGICVENSVKNADKGFDSKKFRRAIHRRKMFANISKTSVTEKEIKEGKSDFLTKKFTTNDSSMKELLLG
ncbi:MAG: transposase [Xanthomarina gelatinilytica]|uniref:transposase n=1 Tax=Xanthomarina gelatinilytica TaxID=1137281 RepID=UPI003A879EE1